MRVENFKIVGYLPWRWLRILKVNNWRLNHTIYLLLTHYNKCGLDVIPFSFTGYE
jgi:hypothetical protein